MSLSSNTIELTDILTAIETLPEAGSSSASGTAVEKDVNFIDYDGTLLYSYTIEEAAALTELPPLPEHEGLVCQGWNWTLEEIITHNRKVTVGALYTTDEGVTRLYIRIDNYLDLMVNLNYYQSETNNVVINWGDGNIYDTAPNLDEYGRATISHEYIVPGEYIITMFSENGLPYTLGHYDGLSIISSEIVTDYKSSPSILVKAEIGNFTIIGPYAFTNCIGLTSISIPDSLPEIGDHAFSECYNLKSIVIPNNEIELGDYVFFYCHKLSKVSLSYGMAGKLSSYLFDGCTSLENITIPDTIYYIADYAFKDCRSLTSIHIPANVTDLDPGTFSGCTCLASIPIYSSLESIGDYAFENTASLGHVTIPYGVRELGSGVFRNSVNLISIHIPDTVEVIKDNAFSYCSPLCNLYVHVTTPPELFSNELAFEHNNLKIYVPPESIDAYISAPYWSECADRIYPIT